MIEKLEGHELLPAPAAMDDSSLERFQEESAPLKAARVAEPAAAASEATLSKATVSEDSTLSEESRITLSPEVAVEESAITAESAITIDPAELRGAIEAVLFSVSEPIAIRTLAEVLGVSLHEVRAVVEELRLEYIDLQRAFRIEDIAGGVQLLTVSKFDPWIRRLRQKEKESRLTPASLETLAVIAYKQPIGKADLEGIRGVGCGPTLKTLLERGLIQIVGRGEGLGKPLLYGTTRRFLESFAISSVRELPQPELLDRPPGLDGPSGAQASRLPPPPMAGVELPEGSVPDAEEPVELASAPEVEPTASDASLADASGPLS